MVTYNPPGLRGLLLKHLVPALEPPDLLLAEGRTFVLSPPILEGFTLPPLQAASVHEWPLLAIDLQEIASAFVQPTTVGAGTVIPDADTFDVPDEEVEFEIVDLLPAFQGPVLQGRTYSRQESPRSRQTAEGSPIRRSTPNALARPRPHTNVRIDLFELIYPILLPPAATEIRGELVLPENLYPFQYVGAKWLLDGPSKLLADEMGLGKTVQTLVAFRALVRRGQALRMLVVCPRSVLTNWQREAHKWAPELATIQITGAPPVREGRWRTNSAHIFLTTYQTMRIDNDIAKRQLFDLVVLDEAQNIKNPDTQVTRAAYQLVGARRWGLTGTPLENRIEDLCSVLRFITSRPVVTADSPRAEIQAVLQRLMLRRRKVDVLPDLPSIVADVKFLELLPEQRHRYDLAEAEAVRELRGMPQPTLTNVLAKITLLKQICNFDAHSGKSAKLEFVADYLDAIMAEGDKAILSSQFVQTLEWLRGELDDWGAQVYSGQLSGAQRDRVVHEFETNPEVGVLLLSMKAGGTGLNLQRANHVLHYDLWWNPAVHEQVTGRAHRIGQKKNVFVTTLLCENTIEERIQQLLDRKRDLFRLIDDLSDTAVGSILSEEEIFGLFGLRPPARPARSGASPPGGTIRPETPFNNLKTIREAIRACRQYVKWADPHFRTRAFEDLASELDDSVKEVLILSGDGQDIVGKRARADFARFRDELRKRGVSTEWRVGKRFSHDRFLITRDVCLNVPPVGTIYQGGYSELLPTSNLPPWDEWWTDAVPLEDAPMPADAGVIGRVPPPN